MLATSAERAEWLRDVACYSLTGRLALAAQHDAKAIAVTHRCNCVLSESPEGSHWHDPDTGEITTRRIGGKRCCVHRSSALWHKARAAAQVERFDRVALCSVDSVIVACGDCGADRAAHPVACDNFRLCLHCRGVRARQVQARFLRAREVALERFARYRAVGLRERFLTLTYPDTGDPAADCAALYAAWPRFVRRLRGWISRSAAIAPKVARALPFVRVVEVTPGATGGHCHLHVWMLAPYLPHVIVRQLWARSLSVAARARLPRRAIEHALGCSLPAALDAERSGDCSREVRNVLDAARVRVGGRCAAELYWPVVDVRACDASVAAELVKYLVKDQTRTGDESTLIDGPIFAAIFLALEGRRCIVAARRFWLPAVEVLCPRCGSPHARVRIQRDPHGCDDRPIASA